MWKDSVMNFVEIMMHNTDMLMPHCIYEAGLEIATVIIQQNRQKINKNVSYTYKV